MGYFDNTTTPPVPDLPVPHGLALWDNGSAGLVLAWERPLALCDGFVLLAGRAAHALVEVARLAGGRKAPVRWAVVPPHGPWYAVACWRGERVGAASAVVVDNRLAIDDSRLAVADGRPMLAQLPENHLEALCHVHCLCCTPPQPLGPSTGALACPFTGELHAVLANGTLVRASELPYGLCRCCEARQPLLRCAEAIVCYANPSQEYHLAGGRYLPLSPSASVALADAGAIDAALRANSALLGVNGVFVRE